MEDRTTHWKPPVSLGPGMTRHSVVPQARMFDLWTITKRVGIPRLCAASKSQCPFFFVGG